MAETLLHKDLRTRLRQSFGKSKENIKVTMTDGRRYFIGLPCGCDTGMVMIDTNSEFKPETLIFDDIQINKDTIVLQKYDRDVLTIFFEKIDKWEVM